MLLFRRAFALTLAGLTTSSSLDDLTTWREGSADEGAPTSRDLLEWRNKGLWLAVDKIIHDDDIQIGYFQDPIARGNSD